MNSIIRHNNPKISNEMTEPENTVENPFKEFLRLKKELMKERAGLVERIQQINTVLNAQEFYYSKTANIKFRPQHKVQTPRNTMTLKAAVIMITRRRPLTKEEILVELEEVGYEFATPKPMNSLNTTLYAKGVFKNENGRFSPTESTLEEYYP